MRMRTNAMRRAPLSRRFLSAVAAALFLATSASARAIELDLSNSAFDPAAYDASGPKDLFKAIFDPRYLPLDEAANAGQLYYLKDDGWLFLVSVGGQVRLYPMPLMNWHHVSNETFAGEPVGVSYCLLTGSSVAFSSRIPERKKSFAVAGSLYNSNLVMYDKQTGSLWPQLDLKAYSGIEKGKTMDFLPMGWVRYGYARKKYAKTPVLAGSVQYKDFLEMYNRLPGDNLSGYDTNDKLFAPVIPAATQDAAYPLKELFILFPKENAAFRFSDAARFPDRVDTLVQDGAIVQVLPKKDRPFITLYWFALKAFYPGAALLK